MLGGYFPFANIDTSLVLVGTEVLVGAVVGYISWRIFYERVMSPLRDVPGPFLNSITSLVSNIQGALGKNHSYPIELHEKYGPVVRIAPDIVSISDPKDIRTVLATHDFRKSQIYKDMELVEPNTFSAQDPKLNSERRRQIGPTFTWSAMSKMESLVYKSGPGALIEKIEQLIRELGFGKSFKSVLVGHHDVIRWAHETVQLCIMYSIFPWLRKLPMVFPKWHESERNLLKFSTNTINERIELNKNAEKAKLRQDLLQAYLFATDPHTNIKMTQSQVMTETAVMLIAGTDTSSETLTWAVRYLMSKKDVLAKLLKEIDAAFPDKSVPIAFQDAKDKLPYLEAIILETLRISPAVPSRLPRDVPPGGAKFGGGDNDGYFLPEGVCVAPHVMASHYDPKTWPDPLDFRPERFLGSEAEANKKNNFGFSWGVRICPGRRLAWIEMMLTLANLFHKYELSIPKDLEHNYKNMDSVCYLMLSPKNAQNNCRISIKRRE
ncbi:hypothetical protein H4219_002811 [Mycoemilia scoparia]|uniref:Cytochrome P450 n=1 Tax=Mycoemilia scoparia TaxID=417184 RepID=A0A9W8A5X3_9FUNG|nr:hypothetical protein H4219_002811 [Mycoemilia scoparia]